MKFKKSISRIHLWLGLSSGLLVFIIAITGCIYAFQEEIQNLTEPYRFVEHRQQPVLPPSKLRAIAERELPGKKIQAVLYAKPGKAVRLSFTMLIPNITSWFTWILFPEVLKVKDAQAGSSLLFWMAISIYGCPMKSDNL